MKRRDLEHLIRAAGAIAESDLIVIGSQAILGQHPDAPAEALRSIEADLIPVQHPERWALIDGAIGEGSPFHETFGYYATGVRSNIPTPLCPRTPSVPTRPGAPLRCPSFQAHVLPPVAAGGDVVDRSGVLQPQRPRYGEGVDRGVGM
jgi:hypothetical protein